MRTGWGLGTGAGESALRIDAEHGQQRFDATSLDCACKSNDATMQSAPVPSLQLPAAVAVWLATGLGVGPRHACTGHGWRPRSGGCRWRGRSASCRASAGRLRRLLVLFADRHSAVPRPPGGRWAAQKDNQAIIWDEIVDGAGRVSARAADELENRPGRLPAAPAVRHHQAAAARQLERLPEGLGVMADDLMAAIYACLALVGAGVARSSQPVGRCSRSWADA